MPQGHSSSPVRRPMCRIAEAFSSQPASPCQSCEWANLHVDFPGTKLQGIESPASNGLQPHEISWARSAQMGHSWILDPRNGGRCDMIILVWSHDVCGSFAVQQYITDAVTIISKIPTFKLLATQGWSTVSKERTLVSWGMALCPPYIQLNACL